MTDILVISPLAAPGENWRNFVKFPTLRAGSAHQIYSPRGDNEFGHPRILGLLRRKGEPPSYDLFGQQAAELRHDHLKQANTAIVLPILDNTERWRDGVDVRGADGGEVATFVPAHLGDRDADWPDWRVALEARGLALLVRGAIDGPATRVVLNTEPPNDAVLPADLTKIAWLNPVAIAFRDRSVPGVLERLDDGLDRTPIAKALKEASPQPVLVENPSVETTRRAIGWGALLAARPECRQMRSTLELLFDPEQQGVTQFGAARHWDLAALDALGGTFVAHWDRDSEQMRWGWAPPAGWKDEPDAKHQYAEWLVNRLGLDEIEKPPERYAVSAPGLASTRERDIDFEDDSTEGLLRALAELDDDSAAQPTLRPLAHALADAVGNFVPQKVDEVFKPLKVGFVRHKSDFWRVDAARALDAIGRAFLKPRSAVLARLDAVERVHSIDASSSWNGFASKAIDLFDDPLKAARLLLDAELATPDSVRRYDPVWPSIYWRHLVGGDATVQFELTFDQDHFQLDVSRLDSGVALA